MMRRASCLLVPMVLASMVGCAASTDAGGGYASGGGGGKADGAGETLEQKLASLNGVKLSYDLVDGVLDRLAAGGTTTEHMTLVRAFLDARTPDSPAADDPESLAVEYGQTALNIFYVSMPRDLHVVGTPSQVFTESTTGFDHDAGYGYAVPFYLSVSGRARVAYTLQFTVADSALEVRVPGRATAAETAKLIADKIVETNTMILENASSSTFNTDHGEFPGLDDIGADVDGSDVVIEPSING